MILLFKHLFLCRLKTHTDKCEQNGIKIKTMRTINIKVRIDSVMGYVNRLIWECLKALFFFSFLYLFCFNVIIQSRIHFLSLHLVFYFVSLFTATHYEIIQNIATHTHMQTHTRPHFVKNVWNVCLWFSMLFRFEIKNTNRHQTENKFIRLRFNVKLGSFIVVLLHFVNLLNTRVEALNMSMKLCHVFFHIQKQSTHYRINQKIYLSYSCLYPQSNKSGILASFYIVFAIKSIVFVSVW